MLAFEDTEHTGLSWPPNGQQRRSLRFGVFSSLTFWVTLVCLSPPFFSHLLNIFSGCLSLFHSFFSHSLTMRAPLPPTVVDVQVRRGGMACPHTPLFEMDMCGHIFIKTARFIIFKENLISDTLPL